MTINTTRPGPWQTLFQKALTLMAALPQTEPPQQWSFGGGTVLMLRYNHRQSKDLDLFVSDPQVLGYLNPRLSDVAETITGDYEEAAEYLKLFLPEGEIDIVASVALTDAPVERVMLLGTEVWVETASEIVAKKLYHRGDKAKGRDLFDLALVIDKDPDNLKKAAAFLLRHRDVFLEQLSTREAAIKAEFEAIDCLDYRPAFEDCVKKVKHFLLAL